MLLVRVGEFYEAFGIDAVMLVEHAGLNPMGTRARAGTPICNIQPTLDQLTAAGLSVAVYEEIDAGMAGAGNYAKSKGIKQRFLSQVSITYVRFKF